MKKKILSALLAFVMLVGSAPMINAAENFSVNAELDYEAAPAGLAVEGETPAAYGQLISVVVYKIGAEELNSLKLEDGSFSENPASIRPPKDVLEIIRMSEKPAEYNGSYEQYFSLAGVSDQQYMIVAASGGGSAAGSASKLLYYETQTTINTVTLPAFQAADATELEKLLRSKQLLLNFNCDADYEANKETVHSLFDSVRTEDYNKNFASITDVQNTLKSVSALRELRSQPTVEKINEVLTANKSLIPYTWDDEDYAKSISEVHQMLKAFLTDSSLLPDSMADVAELIKQAAALVKINSLDATKQTAVIKKYASALGIDSAEYEEACNTYGADSVNAAFVERAFDNPAEPSSALDERILYLEEEKSGSSGNKGNGSGGGGGGGGGIGRVNIGTASDTDEIKPENKPAEKPVGFTDVSTAHWAYAPILSLTSKNILNGFSDGSFAPDAAITREQLVTIIVKGFKLSGTSVIEFSDVASDRWSAKEISIAYANGIVTGRGDGTFAPTELVTRQDAAVMLARVCKLLDIEASGTAEGFIDKADIAGYATESVGALVGMDIISGFSDGSFRPLDTLTRAQAAKIIDALINR